MIFKIGLVLMIFVALPVFLIGVVMFIVMGFDDLEEGDPVRNCSNCNYCTWDVDGWYCGNEDSIWYEEEVTDYDLDYCRDWESDGE